MDSRLLKLTQPAMIGWVKELDRGRPMKAEPGKGVLQVKIVITPEGVNVIALGDDDEAARRVLVACPGNHPPRKMLCG